MRFKIGLDYTPATLCSANDNDWFVHYSVYDHNKGAWKRFKKRQGINYIKNLRRRTARANLLIQVINEGLADGTIDPFPVKPKQVEIPLVELFRKEIEIRKNTLRRRTWQSYKYSIDVLTGWMEKNKLLHLMPKEFTRVHAQEFCGYMMSEKKYKGITFNDRKKDINIFFNAFVDKEMIPSNPFRKIKNQPQEMGKNIAFTDGQRKKLSEVLKQKNEQLFLFTQFIYFCYIRPIELLRLKVSNVNLKNKTIVIYGDQSKNKKTETVVIPDSFVELVSGMKLNKYPQDYYIFSKALKPGETPLGRNRVTQLHTEVLKKLKFPKDVNLYSWKGTGCVNAYRAGIDVYSIMRQCRHSNISQTQTYLKSLGIAPNFDFSEKMK